MSINPLIDRFCESRRRWLIVTGVTFVAGLLTVLPLVDQYFAQHEKQRRLEEDLVVANRAVEQLPSFKKREAAESRSLDAWQQRTVDAERVPGFRSRLVEIVRESGCQLRRINIGAAKSRPWREDDNPVDPADQKNRSTPFTLERRTVSLSVSGATAEIQDLLTRVENENLISHARAVDFRPAGKTRRGMQMDIEMWYFALTREPQA